MGSVWIMMVSLQNITPFFRLEPLLYEIMKDDKTLASSYLDWMEFTGLYYQYRHNKNWIVRHLKRKYTLLQKKCTLISPNSPGDPGSLTLTLGQVDFVKWSWQQDKLKKLKWPEVGVGDLGTSEN